MLNEWLNKEDTLMSGERVGEVTHYFDRISVAAILLTGTLRKGEQVHFLGHGSDFSQEITSIQVEHETIETAVKGQEIAVKVIKPVKQHTAVFLVTGEE
jgi:translation elongation factor EF-1alpha